MTEKPPKLDFNEDKMSEMEREIFGTLEVSFLKMAQ